MYNSGKTPLPPSVLPKGFSFGVGANGSLVPMDPSPNFKKHEFPQSRGNMKLAMENYSTADHFDYNPKRSTFNGSMDGNLKNRSELSLSIGKEKTPFLEVN